MTKMQIKRIKKTPLHKQFLVCFGSLTNSARVFDYTDEVPLYGVIHGKTKQLNRKKLVAGFEGHDKNIAKLKKMLGVKT